MVPVCELVREIVQFAPVKAVVKVAAAEDESRCFLILAVADRLFAYVAIVTEDPVVFAASKTLSKLHPWSITRFTDCFRRGIRATISPYCMNINNNSLYYLYVEEVMTELCWKVAVFY